MVDEELRISATHMKLKAPWPVAARDFVIAGRAVTRDDGSMWLVSTSVEHPSPKAVCEVCAL